MPKQAKYQGLGNDFLLLDGTDPSLALRWPAVARRLCDRRYGIGADGLIVVFAGSGGADLTMSLYNADGSPAEMSGNGIRCLALFAREAGLVTTDDFVVGTDAGPRQVSVGPISEAGLATVRVDMGHATVDATVRAISNPAGPGVWLGRSVDVGNPHLVLVAEDLEELDLLAIGPALEASRPGGVNVEWVRARPGIEELDLRVWERGVGVTLACGTGSVAAAVAGMAMGLVTGPVVGVHNPGGLLEVDCTRESVELSGPAQRIAWMEADLEAAEADSSADQRAPDAAGVQADPDDWAVVAQGAVEWGWDWATGPGWGTPKG